MGRPAVRRMERPVGRRAMDGAFLAGIIVVLAFAIIGLVSAGIFLADKASGSSSPGRTVATRTTTDNSVARAHAEATSIVQTAQQAGNSIVKSKTDKAKKQAAAIIAAANKKAASTASTQPSIGSSSSSTGTTGSGTALGSGGSTSTGTGGTTSGATTTAPSNGSSLSLTNPGSLPKSWLVVGYNASFGAGPGSAGGIAVMNRSGHTFSGTATVVYNKGGSATAVFTNLAPGQSEVLALNGPAYPGGGYRIIVNPH